MLRALVVCPVCAFWHCLANISVYTSIIYTHRTRWYANFCNIALNITYNGVPSVRTELFLLKK